jgi:UDP-glucuronate 4-epimerase
MRVFVTGSAGFIGFQLSRRLLADGHEVVGFDGLTPYYDVTLKHARHALLSKSGAFTAMVGMLEDRNALACAAEKARPEVIFHLAAQAGVRYGMENPKAYVDSNLLGSWNVLEVARELKPEHLLVASSSSVYGSNEDIPFKESDSSDRPLSLYAATKKAMEVMTHAYAHLHGIPTTVLRFFTVYGPWGRPDMALFKFTDAILNSRPIEIYGDGRMERDFTYVDDLVEAAMRLLPLKPDNNQGAPFRIVNIGGGRPVSVIAFVEILESLLKRDAIRHMLPMQPGDMPRTFACSALLEQLTNYRPSTPLATGVAQFLGWYRDYYGV